ncbi:MAG TPA: purine-nucleoside phosphorylase [Planctomycetota bacterium]|nr:purine-nucleoside phosphorylase [Planctomycetota bacterium]
MPTPYEIVERAAEAADRIVKKKPRVGIILGTGLGALGGEIRKSGQVSYRDIPGFPQSTVASHAGQFLAGDLAGVPVVAMDGRFHLYEGYSPQEITLPVRVMRRLGAEVLVVSNACGGMNPLHERGDIVIIEDHINLMGVNPLVGPNDERLGPRFPDMSAPYDRRLLAAAEAAALAAGIRAHRGVYVGVLGPNLETRAEYRMLRAMGADCVGMSTVPEVIVAVHAGMRVLGLSVITDRCLPDALEPAEIGDIIAVANGAEPKLSTIVKAVLGGMKRK